MSSVLGSLMQVYLGFRAEILKPVSAFNRAEGAAPGLQWSWWHWRKCMFCETYHAFHWVQEACDPLCSPPCTSEMLLVSIMSCDPLLVFKLKLEVGCSSYQKCREARRGVLRLSTHPEDWCNLWKVVQNVSFPWQQCNRGSAGITLKVVLPFKGAGSSVFRLGFTMPVWKPQV